MDFTDEQIDAVRKEFEADWCECGQDCHVAARLILQARAERDEALEKVHHFEKWFGHMEASANAHWKDLCEMTAERIAALEERINHLKCQLECNWCEGAGRKDGKPCDICEAGKSIATLEAENAELQDKLMDLRAAMEVSDK